MNYPSLQSYIIIRGRNKKLTQEALICYTWKITSPPCVVNFAAELQIVVQICL